MQACCDGAALETSVLKKALPKTIFHSIDEKTTVTKWDGDVMAVGMAVECR